MDCRKREHDRLYGGLGWVLKVARRPIRNCVFVIKYDAGGVSIRTRREAAQWLKAQRWTDKNFGKV